jgi:hypothetical protein
MRDGVSTVLLRAQQRVRGRAKVPVSPNEVPVAMHSRSSTVPKLQLRGVLVDCPVPVVVSKALAQT